jgi:hypothetical protein
MMKLRRISMLPRSAAIILTLLLLLSPFTMVDPTEELTDDKAEDTAARSVGNAPLWAAHGAGSSSTDSVQGIAMDAMGRTYVCGYFYNSATFGQFTLNSYGSHDVFVGRITAGNWDWVVKAGGTSSDQCQDIAVDDGGNSTITGYFYGSATFGGTGLSSQGSNDIFVARLDSSGVWQWATRAGGSSADYGYGVAMDQSGKAYITGYYYNTAYFGSYTLAAYSYDEAFVAGLDSNGVFTWAQRMYGSYYQRGRDIDVNEFGELAVTGEFSYRINIGGSELRPSYSSSNYYRIFVAKYDTSGQYQWAKMAGHLSSSYSSYGEGVAIDDAGNVAIAARFQYLVDFDSNSNNRIFAYQNSNNWDCLVAKYDTNGNYDWAQVAGGSSTDYCYDLHMDNATGNITVAGMFQSTAWFANTQMPTSGSTDAFIAHVPSAGGWTWIKKFGGSGGDYGHAVAMRNGMYALGGYFSSSASDGSGSLTLQAVSGADAFVLMHGSDQDGDGVGDSMDDFPWESSQWSDTDGDGYGDNLGGWQGDGCPLTWGDSIHDRFGCPDADGDGWSDAGDALPLEPSQWEDADGDGFGENPAGVNPDDCPFEWGDSTRDRLGCRDLDSDGQSDLNDDFINDPTQWSDSDDDGLGDNWGDSTWNDTRMEHWPGMWFDNATHPDPSPLDFDGDGFEDEDAGGPWGPFDDCVLTPGTSTRDLVGCPDADGDGWSDMGDDVDDNPTQWNDADGDGYGDNAAGTEPDACPNRPGTSFLDVFGCPDNDGDGLSNDADECPATAGESANGCPDADGDGWVDGGIPGELDDCPLDWGTSWRDRNGCPDLDSDGTSDQNDPFPNDPTQWADEDEDGFGDEPGGMNADDCLNWAGTSDQDGMYGCPDSDGDGYADAIDPWNSDPLLWSDSDNDGYADQQGTDQSDDCPQVHGESHLGFRGCKDMDGDGWPDTLDLDIDGDGYTNEAELFSNPPSDIFDPTSTPPDADRDFIPDSDEIVKVSAIDDPVMQGVIAVLATGLLMTLIMAWTMFGSGKNRRREYEAMQRMIEEAEGFAGLAEVEAELDSMLMANRVGAGQGLLLKDRLESRRFNLEDDLAGAATHPVGATEAQSDSDLAIIEQHGQVTSWVDDSSAWTAEQQAWHAQAKQWGGYYDDAGNWVPLQ